MYRSIFRLLSTCTVRSVGAPYSRTRSAAVVPTRIPSGVLTRGSEGGSSGRFEDETISQVTSMSCGLVSFLRRDLLVSFALFDATATLSGCFVDPLTARSLSQDMLDPFLVNTDVSPVTTTAATIS